MHQHYQGDHVFPRPVDALPDFAPTRTRRALAERVIAAFGLSEAAGTAVSSAVVDPSAARHQIGEPTNPTYEEIPVPGGTVYGIRTHVWARRIMPDPRNPRIGPTRRHPYAVDPGMGGEDARFRPVPEPTSPLGQPDAPELMVRLESRLHLEWAQGQAANYIFAKNDWRESIASQGVMEAVWLVATQYVHDDGSDPVTVLTTVEGSSRTTAVHALLGVRSADVPYETGDHAFRAHIRRLNEALESGPTGEHLVALRCERVPALILVGFRKHPDSTAGFPTAVKSLVALRHVEPPTVWGAGPENEALADEALDELSRRTLISETERNYYAGQLTRAECRSAHLPDDPTMRATRIVELFASADPAITEALRAAVTSQSTRKRITIGLRNDLATALIVRSIDSDASHIDQVRRYLRAAFGKAVHAGRWKSTGREVEALAAQALAEARLALGDPTAGDPGPATLEMAVRAAYPLVVSRRLNADRGTANNDQPDRRTPGEVLEVMRRRPHGVLQLAQALRDFAADQPIRAVDEDGRIIVRSDGAGEQMVNDFYLRTTFPPPGRASARRGGATPAEQLHNALSDLGAAMQRVEEAYQAAQNVLGDDGLPLVETVGANPDDCRAWRSQLKRMDDDFNYWGRTYGRRYGAGRVPGLDARTGESQMDEGLDDELEAADERAFEEEDALEETDASFVNAAG
jgi:hypothetical protein